MQLIERTRYSKWAAPNDMRIYHRRPKVRGPLPPGVGVLCAQRFGQRHEAAAGGNVALMLIQNSKQLLSKGHHQSLRQEGHSIFAALASPDENLTTTKIQILDSQAALRMLST